MVTRLGHISASRSHSAARGLGQEGDNIGSNKDPDDPPGPHEKTVFGVEVGRQAREDHVAEGEVSARGEQEKLKESVEGLQ